MFFVFLTKKVPESDSDYSNVLSLAERNVYSALKGVRRTEWLAGRVAAKRAISHFLKPRPELSRIEILPTPSGAPEWKLLTPEKNKPFLWKQIISFSISHTLETGISVASNTHKVGIDIEQVRDFRETLQHRFLTKRELVQTVVRSKEAQKKIFSLLWSYKEAFLKILGTGFKTDPRTIEIILRPDGKISRLYYRGKVLSVGSKVVWLDEEMYYVVLWMSDVCSRTLLSNNDCYGKRNSR